MKDKGILKNWNDKRGFGFVECKSYDEDIFIHFSALQYMSRKPRNGDLIYFDRMTDDEGKVRAEYASIKGVEAKPIEQFTEDRAHSDNRVERVSRDNNKPGFFLILMGLLSVFYLYQTFSANPLPIPMPEFLKELMKKNDVSDPANLSRFSCQGKRHCSQMSSCDEAKFYLRNCPNVKIDGDRDGVPCERQLCR